MKTLVPSSASWMGENISMHLVADNIPIDLSGGAITINTGPNKIMIVAGGNWPPAEAVVHENVTTITDGVTYLKGTSIKAEDWVASKYTYNGSVWADNPTFVDPLA